MEPKFKRRFFEPLVLLKALSQTQGDRIPEEIDQFTERSSQNAIPSRREFERQLCHACDYKKGGETVTSLALEETPQGPVYWISVREPIAKKVEDFLRELLEMLGGRTAISSTLQKDLLSRLVTFAAPRIRAHRSLLKKELESAQMVLNEKSFAADQEGVQIWIDDLLQAIENCQPSEPRQLLDLCQLLYDQRIAGKCQRQLKYLETLQSAPDRPGGQWVKHYMGRLASVVHSSFLLSNASKTHQHLLEGYDITIVHCGQEQSGPPPKGKIDFEGIVRRMESCKLKDPPGLVRDLHRLDRTNGLASEMKGIFNRPDFKLRVHTELALLEAVYAADIEFYDGDRYIACSKGACFCCYLYICQHPGRFVHPASHNKIWLNWAPPALPSETSAPNPLSFKEQRDLLIGVNNDIRRRAVEKVQSKTGSKGWHPDSTTGMGSAKPTFQVPVIRDVMARSNSVEGIRSRSSSVDSIRANLEPEALPERSSPTLVLNEESDWEDGGVALDLVSAQISKLGI